MSILNKPKSEPNFIILIVLSLSILFYIFHTKEAEKYEKAILKQQDIIQSQKNLIRIYEMYYNEINQIKQNESSRFN